MTKRGADVNARSRTMNETSLEMAAKHQHFSIAELVLQSGTEIDADGLLGTVCQSPHLRRGRRHRTAKIPLIRR